MTKQKIEFPSPCGELRVSDVDKTTRGMFEDLFPSPCGELRVSD